MRWATYALVSLYEEYCNMGAPAPVYGYCLCPWGSFSAPRPVVMQMLILLFEWHFDKIHKYIKATTPPPKKKKSTCFLVSFLFPDGNKETCCSSTSSGGMRMYSKCIICVQRCGAGGGRGVSVYKVKVVFGVKKQKSLLHSLVMQGAKVCSDPPRSQLHVPSGLRYHTTVTFSKTSNNEWLPSDWQ